MSNPKEESMSSPREADKGSGEKDIDDKIRKSLRYSILDGSFYSSMVGFGESFFAAFAIFLRATNFQIGLIGSLPHALGSLLQIYSNRMIGIFGSRKRFVYIMAFLQALMYIPIALVFFFGTLRVFHLIFFVCLYWIFGMIANAAWNSWMGDLVSEGERGSYFGRRNEIAGTAAFITFLIGGFILQHYSDGTSAQYIGFAAIFAIAMLSRLISVSYLLRKYEPEFHITKEAQFSFMEFIRQARFRNYGLFVIFLCLMNFAVYIASPFFAAFMLNDLRFDYITFTLITAVALIAKYLMMPVWGRAADRFGTKKMLALSGYMMPLVPLLWAVFSRPWELVLIQMYSGFVWAGFEISSFNFIFDTTSHDKRATCVAYYNVLNGISIFAGSMLGILILRFNHLFWSSYITVFVASFIARYVMSFIFLPKLKEVRHVQQASYRDLLLHTLTITPTMGMMHRLITFKKGLKFRL